MSRRFNWPGHNYLGPGNPLDGAVPVDADDNIAKRHDEAYDRATGYPDIRKADEQAIDEFAREGNVHSVIGALGLGAKKTWEDIFGPVYPNMAPKKPQKPTQKPHAGKEQYKQTVARVHSKWVGEDGGKTPWKQFIKQHWRNAWTDTLQIIAEQNARKEADVAGGSKDTAGPSNKRAAEDTEDQPGSSKIARGFEDDDISGVNVADWNPDDFDTDMFRMDVDPIESVANPSQGADNVGSAGASGGRSGAGRTGSTGSAMIIGIPKVPRNNYVTRSYKKSWVFFSYAFSHKVIAKPDNQYNNHMTTPLLLIPVDLLAFYMDDTEWQLLRGRNVAVSCRATVRPLGCRMNFQINSSTSTWATSEFVPIGQSVIGLNTVMPIKNQSVTPDAAKPMVPMATADIDCAILDEKLYGGQNATNRGMVNMVPRHLNLYATIIMPTQEAGNLPVNKAYNNVYGGPKLDQYVERWLVNSCIGQPVVSYEYKCKNGVLMDHYDTMYINDIGGAGQDTGKFLTSSSGTAVDPSVLLEPAAGGGTVGVQGKSVQTTTVNVANKFSNRFIASRYQALEHIEEYRWHEGLVHGIVQPQVHVGLTAVPAINPATDNVDFQNASIYWAVDCELITHEYEASQFHYGPICSYFPSYYRTEDNGRPRQKDYYAGLSYNHHLDYTDVNRIRDNTGGDLQDAIFQAPLPPHLMARGSTSFR